MKTRPDDHAGWAGLVDAYLKQKSRPRSSESPSGHNQEIVRHRAEFASGIWRYVSVFSRKRALNSHSSRIRYGLKFNTLI